MSRQNMIYLVIGRIGSGKTDDIKNLVMKLHINFNKVVVFDEFDNEVWHNMETWNHPEWRNTNLPIIPEDKLPYLKHGFCRVIQEKEDNIHYFELFRKLRNTLLVIEDATRMVDPESVLPKPLKQLLFDVKQKNIDLVLVFHSLMDVPAKLARNCRIILLHHTDDADVPKKFTNPKVKIAFDHLKKLSPEKEPFARVAIPININLRATNR